MATSGNRATDIWVASMKLGALTRCHQKYERSFHVMGYQFPLCARCTGLLAGQFAGLSAFVLVPFRAVGAAPLSALAALSVGILGVDGLGQLRGYWVSNNPRRFATGLLCGFLTTAAFIKLLIFAASRLAHRTC